MIKVVALAATLAACGYSRPADVGPKDGSTTDDDAAIVDAIPDGPPDASTRCSAHGDCYADDRVCLENACTTPDLTCPAASFAQPQGAMGPILYDARQNDIGGHGVRCSADSRCPGANARLCEMEIRFFDPDNNVTASASRVNLLRGDGSTIPVIDPRFAAETITFRACFAGDAFDGVVQIADNAGHNSTPLCFGGNNAYATCNPLAAVGSTGCAANQKCGWIVDRTTPVDGHIGCAPEGTAAPGAACTYGAAGPATGYSNCRSGNECVQGRCEGICNSQDPAACGADSCLATADLLVDGMGANAAGTCKPACHPLTQREGTAEACRSTTATNPNRGCYQVQRQKYTCLDIPAGAKGLTDREPAFLVGGNPVINGCEAGWMPLFFMGTGSTVVACGGLCAPKKTDNSPLFAPNLTGDSAAPAKLPAQATPQAGNGRCLANLKGSENGQGCVFSWFFIYDGTLPMSPLNDTLGYCFAARYFNYDHDANTSTPNRPLPRCDQLPAAASGDCQLNTSTGLHSGTACPDGLAYEWGCYPSNESMLRERTPNQLVRAAYAPQLLRRHVLE